MNLSPKSLQMLYTVHPDLQKVIMGAVDAFPEQLVVMQGIRTAEQELALWIGCHNVDGTRNSKPWITNCNGYAVGTESPEGVAGTGVSNHQSGLAVDIGIEISGLMVWNLPHYHALDDIIEKVAFSLDIPIIYGGTFLTPDSDHWELNHNFYKGA